MSHILRTLQGFKRAHHTYTKMEDEMRARLRVDPARELTCQDLKRMVCLEGRPDIFRQLQGESYRPWIISMIMDVLKDQLQSQSQVRQIFSAMMPRMTVGERRSLMVRLCEDGEFQLVLLLDESYEITAADMGHKDACVTLGHACENGNLELAVWIASRFEFQTQDVIGQLEYVCIRGHAHVMRWLTDRFRLTAAHIRAHNVLLHACCSGDLDFVRWVAGRFGLTARDAREENHRLLWHTCMYKHAQVVTWIMEHFGLGRPGSRLSLDGMFTGMWFITEEQHLRAIWLLEKTQWVRLRPYMYRRFMQCAIEGEFLDMLRWILHRYGLTQKDLTRPAWGNRRWLDVVWDKVWTEAGEVVEVRDGR